MRKKAAVIISLILAMSFCFGTTNVYAKSLSELQKEIEQKQDELEKGQKKEKDLSSKVNDLEKEIIPQSSSTDCHQNSRIPDS